MPSMRRKRDLIQENEGLKRDKTALWMKLVEHQVRVEELQRARDEAVQARDAALERWEQTLEEIESLRSEANGKDRRFDPAKRADVAVLDPRG